jgi:hypothetical protein
MRDNNDLDDFMKETEVKPRRSRRLASAIKTDEIRRRAFRVLALLAEMDAKTRERVLKKAIVLSRA